MARRNREKQKKKATEQQQAKVAVHESGNSKRLVWYLAVFILGFLSGVAFSVFKTEDTLSTSQSQVAAGDQQNQQAILNLEAEVTANPDNYEAWTRLGHLYYDTNQPQKAIKAYTTSLSLHDGDANLLTDLGVMYRRTGQYQKAVEYFDKARNRDATHIPSRYNKGIVLLYDLKDPAGAIASWQEVVQIDPQARNSAGDLISELIQRIKQQQAGN